MSRDKQELYSKLIKTEMKLDEFLNGKNHIQVQLLHQYNDIKDATQIVLNHLANIQNTTVTEIHKKFDLTGE